VRRLERLLRLHRRLRARNKLDVPGFVVFCCLSEIALVRHVVVLQGDVVEELQLHSCRTNISDDSL